MNYTKKRNLFFKEISEIANFCDEKLVEEIYYAMIKVICRQIKADGKVVLPDFGRFIVKYMAPKRVRSVWSKEIITLDMKKAVRFKMFYKMKQYFRDYYV